MTTRNSSSSKPFTEEEAARRCFAGVIANFSGELNEAALCKQEDFIDPVMLAGATRQLEKSPALVTLIGMQKITCEEADLKLEFRYRKQNFSYNYTYRQLTEILKGVCPIFMRIPEEFGWIQFFWRFSQQCQPVCTGNYDHLLDKVTNRGFNWPTKVPPYSF